MGEKRHCSQCSGNFELVPPADPEYKVPRMKPTTDEHIMMVYDCDNIGCQNRIYWEKEEIVNIESGEYQTEPLRSRRGGGKGEGVSPLTSGSNPLFD
jgi:hypothetical protein